MTVSIVFVKLSFERSQPTEVKELVTTDKRRMAHGPKGHSLEITTQTLAQRNALIKK